MSIDLGLERLSNLLPHLPLQYTRPTIHIAGTNGKGSVSALVASIFSHAQVSPPLTVGRFNSPHLVHITDCILINEKPIPYEEYLAARKSVLETDQRYGGDSKLTLFEVLTLTALQLFEKARVDIAVVEVGMGGITDATNIIPSECIIASALTSVDLDHQGFLGNTVADIAIKKAGIARPGKPFVMGPQKPHRAAEVHPAVLDTVGRAGAIITECVGVVQHPDNPRRPMERFEPTPPLPVQFTLSAAPSEPINALLPLHGEHQVENLMTALGVIQALYSRREPLDIPGLLTPKAIIHGIERVSWRGRLSWHTYKGHQVLVDGAHNSASVRALSQYLGGIYPRKAKKIQVTFVLALSHSPPKQPQDTLEGLLSMGTPPPQLALSAAFVPFTPPTDMPWVKYVPPSELVKLAEGILRPRGSIWAPELVGALEEGAPNTYLESALEWAVAQAVGAENLIVVAGSLYLVADFYRLKNLEIVCLLCPAELQAKV